MQMWNLTRKKDGKWRVEPMGVTVSGMGDGKYGGMEDELNGGGGRNGVTGGEESGQKGVHSGVWKRR